MSARTRQHYFRRFFCRSHETHPNFPKRRDVTSCDVQLVRRTQEDCTHCTHGRPAFLEHYTTTTAESPASHHSSLHASYTQAPPRAQKKEHHFVLFPTDCSKVKRRASNRKTKSIGRQNKRDRSSSMCVETVQLCAAPASSEAAAAATLTREGAEPQSQASGAAFAVVCNVVLVSLAFACPEVFQWTWIAGFPAFASYAKLFEWYERGKGGALHYIMRNEIHHAREKHLTSLFAGEEGEGGVEKADDKQK
jgi:hypothetical protein